MSDKSNTLGYHDSLFLRFMYIFIKLTLGTIVRVIWVLEVHDMNRMPKNGPLIVALNHQSFFDFLCFVAVSPRKIHFLSAEKFFSHILWGPLVKLTSQIKVDRFVHDKSEIHKIVYDHLEYGKVVAIFPEGTRSPHQNDMLPAFTGVAEFAIRGNVPVLPVGIKGTYEVMAKHDKSPKFKKIVTIHIGEPVYFAEYHHSKLDKKTFRTITNSIMIEISKLSGKNYPHLEYIDE
ncbi:MAG: 1-acyl-sn-glycerol-3-phosphate acyltransferase [Parcubacteria bacterium C7867-006]|nr:MAG: 1-acyl-sn-glycerol-3-phosphate acyltransferase [Parcubacteria bacterium C7867-006]